MRNSIKIIVLALICLSLQACASGAKPENMTATPMNGAQVTKSNAYFQSISLANIAGGKETNPMLTSQVSNSAFHDALENSLRAYGLLSEGKTGKYQLDAELLAIEQPIIGFSFTVNSVSGYKLIKTSNKAVVLNETIKADGEATMGDAFAGVTRLRLATENSIKNNIQNFINKLNK